jgi:hypothetical protein
VGETSAYSTTSALRPRVTVICEPGLATCARRRTCQRYPPLEPAEVDDEMRFLRGEGKRKAFSDASGKDVCADACRGVRGRDEKLMPRAVAREMSSRGVITQSTSRTGSDMSECQREEVSSERLASSFLSKHGMIARCQT